MPIVNGYATLPELQLQLGPGADLTPYTAKLENVITSVSRWIDGAHCRRHFYQDGTVGTPVARLFDARDWCRLHLGDTPVTVGGVTVLSDLQTVTAFETDETGDGTFETVWSSATDYQLLPLNSPTAFEVRALARSFPRPQHRRRLGLVRITGIWGWPAIPDDVREACLIQSARIFKRKDSPEGVSNFDQFGVIRVSGRLDADVAANLNHLVHPQAVVVAA